MRILLLFADMPDLVEAQRKLRKRWPGARVSLTRRGPSSEEKPTIELAITIDNQEPNAAAPRADDVRAVITTPEEPEP